MTGSAVAVTPKIGGKIKIAIVESSSVIFILSFTVLFLCSCRLLQHFAPPPGRLGLGSVAQVDFHLVSYLQTTHVLISQSESTKSKHIGEILAVQSGRRRAYFSSGSQPSF